MNPFIYFLGDLHLSASQPWRLPVGDAFLEWFESIEVEPNSTLIALGDYTDDAVNPGKVIRQLERFLEIARKKFKKVYLLVGNHDWKLYKNQPQLAFEFAEEKDNVVILRDPAEVLMIDGIKVLSLPHYNYRVDIPPMQDYYENLPEDIADDNYDVVIGHFADASAEVFAHKIDLSYLNTQLICLGDIHNRISENYIGSVFACKISENESPRPRAIWKVHKEADEVIKEEIVLPHFCDFKVVDYPEKLPDTQSPVTVWTVLGAENESIARSFYGEDIFIRGVTLSAIKKEKDIAISEDEFKIGTPLEVFKSWMKEVKEPVDRPVAKVLNDLLKPPKVRTRKVTRTTEPALAD